MEKIILNELELKKLINESVLKVLKENGFDINSLNINNHGDDIKVGEMIFITNKNELTKYAIDIWNILTFSYNKIGGLKSYKDYNDFLDKKHAQRIIISGNKIIACATYRKIGDGYKMVSIGCDQTANGKLGLQQIIQYDIKNHQLYFWAEVSGVIEHYFKKYNGYPIPNIIVPKILNVNEKNIILSNEDEVHYERPIGLTRDFYKKMIFGFKDKDTYYKAIQAVENYNQFMLDVNNMPTDINESKMFKYSVEQAVYIIENIYRMQEEDDLNELIPSWYEALKDSLFTLKNQTDKTDVVLDYIEYGEYLMRKMQPLTLNKFNF